MQSRPQVPRGLHSICVDQFMYGISMAFSGSSHLLRSGRSWVGRIDSPSAVRRTARNSSPESRCHCQVSRSSDSRFVSWAQNGDTVFVEADGEGHGPGSAHYSNHYLLRFIVREGLIVDVLEYYDPFEALVSRRAVDRAMSTLAVAKRTRRLAAALAAPRPRKRG